MSEAPDVQGIRPPYCAVRIWRGINGPYWDATLQQVEGGLVVVNKAENRPGGATFTLANDTDDIQKNICGASFSGWNDGTAGEIRPGQFVELWDIPENGSPRLIMDGRITTMTPTAETVAFEIGDGITFLGKAGTWLRRNYRDTGGTTTRLLSINRDTTPPSIDISLPDATPSSPIIRYYSYERENALSDGHIFLPRTADDRTYTQVRQIRAHIEGTTGNSGSSTPTVRIKVQVGVKIGYSPEFTFVSVSSFRQDIIIQMDYAPIDQQGLDLPVTIELEKVSGYSPTLRYSFTKTEIKTIVDTEAPIYPTSTTVSFEDASGLDLELPDNRLFVTYEGGHQTTAEIMAQIAEAVEYSAEIAPDTPQTDLPIYRVGGSYAQSYLQKLADIGDKAENRRISYTVKENPPKLFIGRRTAPQDPPSATVIYAGDITEDTDQTAIVMATFSPKKTLKNRPNLVTLKGTVSREQTTTSVIVTFEDGESTEARGCTIETILADSNANSLQSIGQAAYNALSGIDLDKWEGELTLPGIVWGMMGEDGTGSGAVIHVIDSRYSINEKVKVLQVEYNYNACTTKLTISNYGPVYSGAIANTNALAVEISDLIGGISDTTLYNQQYAYVKDLSQSWSPGTNPRVAIMSDAVGWSREAEPAGVYILPNGTVAIIAMFEAENDHLQPSTAYGINVIQLRGTTTKNVYIPESRRPDFFAGQTLIVCAVIRSE